MSRFSANGVRDGALYAAWIVALTATLGSLYFSEVRYFVPCTLCWYQRILMYPLVVILAVGAWTRDRHVARYALPLSVAGVIVAGYHVLVQKIPNFGFPSTCRSGVPCSAAYIEWWGFVTIPVLAFTAFLLVSLALTVYVRVRD